MSDADRALPAHIAGTTPTEKRSLPISDIEGLDELLEDLGFVKLPTRPSSGAYTLRSTAGVLSWVAAT